MNRLDPGVANEFGASSPTAALRQVRRIAIVHYWLVTMRGGEKVVEELCRLYPQAEIFTLVADVEKLSPLLRCRKIHTSALQKLPGVRRHYQKLLPLMPFALEHFDLSEFDLVISSESGPAKGVIVRPDAVHLCYCHSPMRYIWDHYHVYRRDLGWLGRWMLTLCAPALRVWDVSTAARVDRFIANSSHVARRIRRFYARPADVVHPPVAVEDFEPAEKTGDFFLLAGQLVSYKRADMAVKAFAGRRERLVVIGEGPQLGELRKIATPNVKFLGFQPFAVLREHLANCRALVFPGEEDFGILPVEAMASGRPVIAFDAGGARETVVDERVGVRFGEQSVEALNKAIDLFLRREEGYDSDHIRRHARAFSTSIFAARMNRIVNETLVERGWAPLDHAASVEGVEP